MSLCLILRRSIHKMLSSLILRKLFRKMFSSLTIRELCFGKLMFLRLFRKFSFWILVSETLVAMSLIMVSKPKQKFSRFRRIDPKEF